MTGGRTGQPPGPGWRWVLPVTGGLAGVGGVIALVMAIDPAVIRAAFAGVGWGLGGVALFRFVILALDAGGWWWLVPPGRRPGPLVIVILRWIGESVNALLPVAQVGGDVVRARLLARGGVPGGQAGASVVADFAVALVTQVAFILLGVVTLAGLLAGTMPAGQGEGGGLLPAVLAGLGLAVVTAGAVVGGARPAVWSRLSRLAGRVLPGGGEGARAVEAELPRLQARRGDLAWAGVWHMAGWLAHVGETWLILAFLGARVGFAEALVIESLAAAVRSAAFMVPGGLGAQEGAVVGLGLAVGLGAETALAVALVKRAREVVTGLPGLVAWLVVERRTARRVPVPARVRG